MSFAFGNKDSTPNLTGESYKNSDTTVQTGIRAYETKGVMVEESTRQRPVMIRAILGDMTSNTSAAPHPLALIDSGSGDQFSMNGFDKGHLVGRRFVGTAADIAQNIVPMHPTFNRSGGVWSQLEAFLAEQVAGTSVRIILTVHIEYLSDSPVVPSGFLVTAQLLAGGFLSFKGVVLQMARITHDATQPIQMGSDTALIDGYGLNQQAGESLLKILKENIVKAEDGSLIYKRGFNYEAVYKKNGVGDEVANRPYSFLDPYMDGNNAVNWISGTRQVVASGYFSEGQRIIIKIANRLLHEGWLVSDYPDDPMNKREAKYLTEFSGPTAAAIDHVHPRAKAGINCFSNAKIASGAYNSTKSDTTG